MMQTNYYHLVLSFSTVDLCVTCCNNIRSNEAQVNVSEIADKSNNRSLGHLGDLGMPSYVIDSE